MIKKIICPTDFSSASENAANYAAKLCQAFGASLELITVESFYVSEIVAPGINLQQKTLTIVEMLEYVCDRINNTFHIPCDFEILISNHSLEKVLEKKDGDQQLFVMGTAGAGSVFKKWFGTTTYHLIKKSKLPILMIPEHVSYGGMKRIVWAAKDKQNQQSFPLNIFISVFKPVITFLHVNQTYTQLQKEMFKDQDKKNNNDTEPENAACELLYSNNTCKSLHDYILYSHANLLVITFYKHGFLRTLFQQSIIKKISQIACYPVLILKQS
ncbi:MAG: hypothetical protein JWO58_1607 [Chitinophagaceae bacterium]|nr:hypothetical protein [Chitinophagaceae bacterium]